MHTQKNSKNILQPATIDHEVHGVPKLQLAYQSHENGSWGNTPKNLDIVIILGVFKQINPKLVFFSWFINMFHPYFPLQMLYDFALSCLFLPFPAFPPSSFLPLPVATLFRRPGSDMKMVRRGSSTVAFLPPSPGTQTRDDSKKKYHE